jgi:hypothetical protein
MVTSLSTLPILRTLQTGCTATAPRSGVIASRGSSVSWTKSTLSWIASAPASALHPQRARAGVEDDRPAAALARFAQRRGELVRLQRRCLREPLALERLTAAQTVKSGRVDDVEAGAPEQPLGDRRQRLGIVAALRPEVARRATREVDDALAAARRRRARHEADRPRELRRPLRQPPARRLANAVETGPHRRRAERAVQPIGSAEPDAQRRRHRGEAARRDVGDAACERAGATPAQRLGQEAGLDADRTCRRAQPARRARLDPLVLVKLLQHRQAFGLVAAGGEPGDLAPADDALARRERQPARRALRLAEAALDALVDERIGGRQRLQVREVGERIGVEDDARIEQALRVEERLDAAHRRDRSGAPFELDERRDVAAGAVLGLQRAVVLRHDHRAHRGHEAAIAVDFGGAAEVLREDEVEVALERVAEDDRLAVAVLPEERLQVERRRGEAIDREGNVLDDHRGSGRAHRADRREHALAHVPERRRLRRVGCEAERPCQREPAERVGDRVDAHRERSGGRRARLDEQRRAVVGKGRQRLGHSGLGLDRAQRRAVEQLDLRRPALTSVASPRCTPSRGGRRGRARSPCGRAPRRCGT